MGVLTALVTVYLEAAFESVSVETAATMGFVAFAMLSIAMALGARSETGSAFNRDVLSDHRQLLLYAMAFLFTFLPTRLPFLQEWLGLTALNVEQWMLTVVLAFGLLLVDEVIKFFMRRSRK